MIPVIEGPNPDDGQLCAQDRFLLKATGCEDALAVEWVAVTLPPGVSADDVVFTNQYGLETEVQVPTLDGTYEFTVKCFRSAP